jgi:Xaa-Pro aminopeptidase
LDNIENAYPVLVEADNTATLVLNVADSAAIGARQRTYAIETYGRYFDWDQPTSMRISTFAEVVRGIAGPEPLEVSADLPVSRFKALSGTGPVEVCSCAVEEPACVYRKRRLEIEHQWRITRDADAAAIGTFVSALRCGRELMTAMTAPSVGFAALEALMVDAGIDGFFVSSPYNAELLTGLPAGVAEQFGLSCLFVVGDECVTVLARRPFERQDFHPLGRSALGVMRLGGKRVGIEEGHLGIAAYRALAQTGCVIEESVSLLRRWQDQRAGTDLPYHIAAANAVLGGFERAKEYLLSRTKSGATEREARAIFDQGAMDFARIIGIKGRLSPYFDIIHSGERTLLPAASGDYPLLPTHKTIKFDMGLLAHDAFGCVRGCSDIARSLSPVPAIQRAHDELRSQLIDCLIPAMRPGMTGGEVHALGIEILRGSEDTLRDAGLIRDHMKVDGYVRDCGHTIHRTTLGSVAFLPGVKQTVEPGMVGCVEFVWPVGDTIIAVEDGFFVSETEVLPFTI